ncbi:FkbM family methyltransferase [Candidatus Pelagibacter ubique]|jgi:FkbM family methyltransferase|nr:FkbM family methyltransferase [Candidatus Pelagibacter ubique]
MNKALNILAEYIKQADIKINFTIIEIGAVQTKNEKEPFYELLDYFPESRIIGFEIEKAVCEKMNSQSLKGVKYYPHALGKANEKRKLYITQHPMCCSLYKPNEEFIKLYNNFEIAYLKKETEIDTISLDYFIDKHDVGNIDFIKIDVQGAELDIFKGGSKALKNVLKIVCEVEFVQHYENQPLFGDVCNYLSQHDIMFNKFLGLAGRALKPIMLNNDPNIPSQHIWSDAVFVHHIQKIHNLSDIQLIKLSLLACVYYSLDLTFYCLSEYDKRNSSSFAKDWMSKISNSKLT